MFQNHTCSPSENGSDKTCISSKVACKTISAHIDYLEEEYLISKANRYDIKGSKYIAANLKYYFTDVGLRNARLNFRQQEPTHLMENIVYNELQTRGYSVDVGIVEVNQKIRKGKISESSWKLIL